MASPPPPSPGDEDCSKDATVAKTAGFVVFSGIAMSIIKAFNPKPLEPQTPPPPGPSPPMPPPPPPPLQEISSKKTTADEGLESKPSAGRTIEIMRGDTLWGLSRKYGVSIDAMKEANGIKGDTIYAGKKLIVP